MKLFEITQARCYHVDGKNSDWQWILRCFAPWWDHAFIISDYQKKRFESWKNIYTKSWQYVTSMSPLLYNAI